MPAACRRVPTTPAVPRAGTGPRCRPSGRSAPPADARLRPTRRGRVRSGRGAPGRRGRGVARACVDAADRSRRRREEHDRQAGDALDPADRAQTLGPLRLHAAPGPRAPRRGARAMASVCVGQPGRSHTTVQSALTSRQALRAHHGRRPGRAAPWCRPRPRRGRWRGSGGPRSPSPAAPSRASATAWATTSASLWPASPAAPGIGHPAEDERAARVLREAVDVESLPDAQRVRDGCRSPSRRQPGPGRASRSAAVVTLRLRGSPGTTRTVAPERLDQGGVVGGLGRAASWARRRTSARKACGVCTATSPSRSTVATTIAVDHALQGVGHRHAGHGRVGAAARPRRPRRANNAGRGQRAGAVVDHDHLGRRRAPRPARPAPTPARVSPPATDDVGTGGAAGAVPRVGTGRRGARGPRRRRRPRAASTAHCTMGRPAERERTASGPRTGCPLPAATTTTHTDTGSPPVRRPRAAEAVRAHPGQGSASSRRFSAASSSTSRAKVSSDTRIWRARLSMRFSPADRPLSLSRIERFRTTSATW